MNSDYSYREHHLEWVIYKQESERFPYVLYIEIEPDKYIVLQVQDKWPGPGKKIFCRIEKPCNEDSLPIIDPIDRCRIKTTERFGKKLTIVLDRKMRKRCWFLFLKKEYKTKPGVLYDQVFWVTQSSAIVRRQGAYIPQGGKRVSFSIVRDKREKYGYTFPYAEVINENLPVGDYGLKIDGSLVAVVERKTLDNLLHEISTFDVLKLKLQELDKLQYKAVVFESAYADFINPKKLTGFGPSTVADIIADLFVSFPNINFVFCENRKTAREWIFRWFRRIEKEFKRDNDKSAGIGDLPFGDSGYDDYHEGEE